MCVEEIDIEMQNWRQGDVVLGLEVPFVTFAHRASPMSAAAKGQAAEAEEGDVLLDVLTDEIGFVVLSQTCDIMRGAQERPYVEIAPIVPTGRQNPAAIRKSSRLAQVAVLEDRGLVADLDRVMVVEKPLLAALPSEARIQGCATEADRRRFAEALARKHARFAVPDAFNASLSKMGELVTKRHGKDHAMGNFLGLIEDVRAYCPDWDAAEPDVMIMFVFPEAAAIPADADERISELVSQFVPTPPFTKLRGQPAAWDTMTAARYRESDSLDFDYLSQRPLKTA